MKRLYIKGFTIVELLVVIVVIAILASISIVMYSGTQDQAEYSSAQSDMKHINDAITIYRAQIGRYPGTNTTYQNASTSLASLVPGYLDSAKLLTPKTGYLYQYRTDATGTDYSLIRSMPSCAILNSEEKTGNPLLKSAGTCPGQSWGYWSSGATSW